jgi:hypothetical protein
MFSLRRRDLPHTPSVGGSPDAVSPFAHGCNPLCDDCVAELFAQLRGVAQRRGETWAKAVARVVPIDRPWPVTKRSRAIARRKIADLTHDERLGELLAEQCELGAARWWNRARERAG